MAEQDGPRRRRRRRSGTSQPAGETPRDRAGGTRDRAGGTRDRAGATGRERERGRRAESREHRPARPHQLKLEVGGHGVELHCDTCDLVVTHLAAPQVRGAVEEAHRRHLGSLTWESAWVAVCSCGWRTGRLGQQAARDELAAHEASVLLPAARGQGQAPPA